MHINTNMVLENPTDVCSFGSRKQSTLLLEIEQAAHARTHIPTWPLTEAIIPLGTPPGVPLIGFQQAASSTAQPQSSHWVCTCAYIYIYIWLARPVYIHRVWPYIWWFPCQNYRIYTPYMTVYLVISLPKIPYIHRIYRVLANPTYICLWSKECCVYKRVCVVDPEFSPVLCTWRLTASMVKDADGVIYVKLTVK